MRILPILFLLVANASFAQQTFPTLQGETAAGKAVTLPDPKAKGFTVIGLAYSAKAQAALEAWFEPAYTRFVAKYGLFANAYQCEAYFVPLFTGTDKVAYEPRLKRFRNSAEPDGCACGQVMTGRIKPVQCPQFGAKSPTLREV